MGKYQKSYILLLLLTVFIVAYYIFMNSDYDREEFVGVKTKTHISSGKRPQKKNNCVPKYNIVYAKLAKTGSTTLQNILARKAFNEDIFTGSTKDHRSPHASKHMIFYGMQRFVYNRISAMVPPDTVYIAMLREPVKHFKSTFYQFRHIVPAFQKADNDNPLRDYLENAHKYTGNKNGERWWAEKNTLFYELGYNPLNEDVEYIQKAINELDKELDLVLLTEHYDISLLLLQDILCWEMEDIVYLTLNSRAQSVIKPLDPELNELVYKWNKADTALHKHFNSTFWLRVEQYGRDRLETNLKRFKKMNENFYNDCIEKEIVDGVQNKTKYVLRESVEPKICQQAFLNAPSWRSVLQNRNNFI